MPAKKGAKSQTQSRRRRQPTKKRKAESASRPPRKWDNAKISRQDLIKKKASKQTHSSPGAHYLAKNLYRLLIAPCAM